MWLSGSIPKIVPGNLVCGISFSTAINSVQVRKLSDFVHLKGSPGCWCSVNEVKEYGVDSSHQDSTKPRR